MPACTYVYRRFFYSVLETSFLYGLLNIKYIKIVHLVTCACMIKELINHIQFETMSYVYTEKKYNNIYSFCVYIVHLHRHIC